MSYYVRPYTTSDRIQRGTGFKTSSIALDFPSRLIIELNTFRKVDFPTRAFPTAAITRIGRSICDISFKTSGFSSNAFGELFSFTECSRILACCASVTITKPESERSVPKAISSKQIMVHSLLDLIHNFDCLIVEKRIKITTLRFSPIKSVSVRRDKREKIEVVTINLYALKTCYDVGAFNRYPELLIR